jgi:hypothetical protein
MKISFVFKPSKRDYSLYIGELLVSGTNIISVDTSLSRAAKKKPHPKTKLGLPDLDQAKAAILGSLHSFGGSNRA